MFERFAEESRRAVYFARADATYRRQTEITPSDLLTGLMREAGSKAASPVSILLEHEVALRRNLDLPLSMPLCHNPPVEIPLNHEGRRALLLAVAEADASRESAIELDHLLCGILTDTAVRKAAESCSVSLASFRRLMAHDRQVNPRPKISARYLMRERARKLTGQLAGFAVIFLVLFVLAIAAIVIHFRP